MDRSLTAGELVLRYLAAFGPARPADMATWSRLTGLAAAFDAVKSDLVVFRDERGRDLFDVPDAPRPDPATTCACPVPAGVRQRAALARRPHPLRRSRRAGALSARAARPRPRARRRHAARRRGSSTTAASRCSTSSCRERDRDEVRHAATRSRRCSRSSASPTSGAWTDQFGRGSTVSTIRPARPARSANTSVALCGVSPAGGRTVRATTRSPAASSMAWASRP